MWKAILVLFVMTESHPMTMMTSSYDQQFTSKDACQKYADRRKATLNTSLDEQARLRISTERNVHILSHTVTCLVDETGTEM